MRFKIKLPPAVDMLLERLRLCGFQAYVVGGCVRDSILGKDPYDWDICTDALPAEVMGVFGTDNVIPTGLKHGTVTVKLESDLYEVTTFREDGEYSDGRHPDDVHFVKDIKGDLARRDFTINAMAYNPSEGFIDPFGGRKDIMRGVIRCVGEPDKRFEEDALRILRAARFQASLGFSIDWKTAQAMNRLAPDLERVSSERIGSELHKLLCAPYAALSVQKNREVLFAAIPELAFEEGCKQNNRYHYTDVFGHTLAALQNMQQCEAFPKEWADEYVCFALLFHDIGKPSVRTTDADGYDHFYITLPEDYLSIPVNEAEVLPSEEGWNDFVSYLKSGAGKMVEITDRAAEMGDTVTLDFTGTVDGVAFEGGSAEDFSLELGSGRFIDGFEEQIAGHNAGDEFDVTVTFPEGYEASKDAEGNEMVLAGKEAVFAVTLKSVGQIELTDEGVAGFFGDDNLMLDGQTKVDSLEKAREYYEERELFTNIQNAVMVYLEENSVVESLPESVINNQLEVEKQYCKYMATVYGYEDIDTFLAENGYDGMDDYLSAAKETVEGNVTRTLILQAVAEKEGIEAQESDFQAYFGSGRTVAAENYGKGYTAQLALEYSVGRLLQENVVLN